VSSWQKKFFILSALLVVAVAVFVVDGSKFQPKIKLSANKPQVTTTLPSVVLASSTPRGNAVFLGSVMRVLVDNCFIGYRMFGSGQNLVLIAGQDQTMSFWGTTLLSDLSKHYHVVAFDNPGAGYSTYNGSTPMTIETLAKITGDFLTSIGINSAIVMGWGMGGEIALGLSIDFPQLVQRLVVIGSSAGGQDLTQPEAGVNEIIASTLSTLKQRVSLMFYPDSNETAINSYLADIESIGDLALTNNVMSEQAEAQNLFTSDNFVVNNIGKISIPVLIVDGAQDQLFPVQNSDYLAAALTYTTKVIKPGSGYFFPIDQEAYFISLLESFTG